MKAILVFDLGGTYLKYGLCTPDGELLFHSHRPSNAKEGLSAMLSAFKNSAGEARAIAFKRKAEIVAVGVGAPGAIDQKSGTIFGSSPNSPGLVGVSLKDLLRKELNSPVAIDNDANLAALGEAVRGAGRGYDYVLALTLGTGIGGGFVQKGEIYRGAHGSALEVGHISVESNGRICGCGKAGHIEAYASGSALIKRTNELTAEMNITDSLYFDKSKPIFSSAKNGYRPAVQALKEAVSALSLGLANLANTLNPDCIVIGGGVMFGFSDYWEELERRFNELVVDALHGKIPLLQAQLGNTAGMVGAGLMAGKIGDW
jgi:glucokinase